MAEITGGELSFELEVNVDQFKKGLMDAEGNVQGFSTMLEKFGQKADDVFFALGQNAKNQDVFLKNLETQFSSITKVIESLRDTAKAPILADGLDIDKAKLQEIEPYLKAYEEKYTNLKKELISLQSEMSSINDLRSQERQEIDALKKKVDDYQTSLQDLRKSMQDVVPGELPKAFKEVTLEADKTAVAFKSVSDVSLDFGITKENLAIQKQVIAEIKKNIEEIEKRAKDMAPGMAQASVLGELKPLKEELAAEEKALASLEVEMKKTAVSATTLSTKYLEAKNRLAELTLANKQGTPEYVKAEAEVRKYGTALSDANARAKALTAGTIGSLAQGLSLITGTMATGTALLGAFGGKSEELNQIMLKTQALLAATVTLQEIKNTTVQKGGVISGIMAVQEMARSRATSLATVNTVRATIAQKALNLVANANPYILLATAILTVVGALALYVSATNKAEAETKKLIDLNKKVADSVAEPLVAYKNLQSQWNALGNDLKAKEKFIKDNKDEFAKLGVEVNNVNDAENVLRKNSQAFVQAMMLRAKSAALAQIAIENMKQSLELESEYKRKNIDKNLTVGEIAMRTLTDGPGGVASRQRAKNDAEKVRQSKQKDVDIAAEQLKVEKELQALNSKSNFSNPTKNEKEKVSGKSKTTAPKNIADEYFPPGSVAEIQKRMSEIDKALSKSNNDKSTELLKKRRIEIAIELAAAEKKIRIRSFDEEMEETKKQIELRDQLIQAGYAKDQVDQMLPDVKDKSYIGYLEETAKSLKDLVSAGDNTEQTATNLINVQEAINEFKGYSSFIDDVSKSLENLKSRFSGSELISELEKYKNVKLPDATEAESNARRLAAQKAIEEENKAIEATQRQFYNDFLKEKETFEQQKATIDAKYNSLDAQINGSDKSADEKSRLLAESAKARGREYSQAFLDSIKDTAMWEKAFSDIAKMTSREMKKAISDLKTQLATAKTNGATATEIKTIQDRITELQNALNANPFEKIASSFKKLGDETLSTSEKLSVAQDLFNGLGEGVQMLGDAFGGFDEQTQDTVNSFMEIGNAAFDLGKSISSGDVAGMISAGIKLIGSIAAAFNGDKKKEREIKRQQKAIKELERAYNDLSRAIDKALGDKFFDASRQGIENLKQQKNAINEMIRQEESKKKKNRDNDKIADWKQQLKDIDNTIGDIGQSMVDKVLNGLNAKGLADQFSDALTTAFANGEDAAEAMGKTVDNIMRDMVKNALKMKILEPAMQGVIDKILGSMGYGPGGTGSFDGLTESELAEIKAMAAAAGQNFTNAWSAVAGMFGDSAVDAQGIKGDIKGITEKTAGALEAQVNALRIHIAEGLSIQKSNQAIFVGCLQNLVLIEYNTRPLHRIDQNIEEMNSKMSRGLAGF